MEGYAVGAVEGGSGWGSLVAGGEEGGYGEGWGESVDLD